MGLSILNADASFENKKKGFIFVIMYVAMRASYT